MTNLSDFSHALADAVQAASPSIVTVLTPRPVSGTVVAPDCVLTVAHTLRGDDVTLRTADGRELAASVAGRDPVSDLALLKVEGLNLPPLSAAGDLRPGELLLALGRPLHGPQATLGLHGGGAQPGLQQEAPRGPLGGGWLAAGAEPFRGASGGALLDARGGLVGLLNAGIMRGTLLAVPAERALKVAGQLATAGRVARGYLGVATQPVHFPDPAATPDMGTNTDTGTDINTATSDPSAGDPHADPSRGWGPWSHQGRHEGQHEGQREGGPRFGSGPRDPRDRQGWFERRGWEGRGGEGRGAEDRSGRGPWKEAWAERRAERWGGEAQEGGRPGWGRPGHGPRGMRSGRLGLMIVQVEAASPAEAAGLKVGDTLLSLDGAALRHPRDLMGWIHQHAGETVQALVLRSGEEQTVELTLGER